ncbi:MAG: hypothetical protein ACKV0T_07870 [Planctomycetales bacterium]
MDIQVKLNPERTLKFLLVVIALLLCANILGILARYELGFNRGFGLIPLFNLDAEGNIPTLYSGAALFLASLLLRTIALRQQALGQPSTTWTVLALIFLFLSVDELVTLHELLGKQLHKRLPVTRVLYCAWAFLYGIGVAILFLCCLRWLWRLERRVRRRFVLSGAIFLLGAIGFELLGARQNALFGIHNLTYELYYTCEESLEMLGVAVFIFALLDVLRDSTPDGVQVTIKFDST